MLKKIVVTILFVCGSIYTQDGSLDTSFGTNGIVMTDLGGTSDQAFGMAVQPDNKIVVVGSSNVGGTTDFAVVRYNTNGSLDNTFGTNGVVITNLGGTDRARSVIIQLDGKIIAIGSTSSGFTSSFALVRYKSDGSLDTSFGTNGVVTTSIGASSSASSGVLLADGKIIAAGSGGALFSSDFALVRYKSDGSLDTSFGTGGIVTTNIGSTTDTIQEVVIQPDGKILAGGTTIDAFTARDFAVARYNTDGSLDNSFGTGGIVITSFGPSLEAELSLALQRNGKIVAAGFANPSGTFDVAIARYNSNGSLDNTFGTNGLVLTDIGTNDRANQVIIGTDGKIITFGWSNVNGDFDFALLRYNTDGTLDDTFGTDGIVITNMGGTNDLGYDAIIQADGKIITCGYSNASGANDFALARYITPSIIISSLARDIRAKYTILQNLYL